MRSEAIEYRHNGTSRASKDVVGFTVSAGSAGKGSVGAETRGQVTFHIYPESYWEPLVIVSNNSLLVDESTSIAITEEDLQVSAQVSCILMIQKERLLLKRFF